MGPKFQFALAEISPVRRTDTRKEICEFIMAIFAALELAKCQVKNFLP